MRVPAGDLKRQTGAIRAEIDAAVGEVLDSGWYVLGKQLEQFEAEFAAYQVAAHAIGVGSGMEALHLALVALGIGPGDEVITTPLTAAATVCAIQFAGATPVFADIDPGTFTLDPESAAARVTSRTRALLPVHLYGQTAEMSALGDLARRHGIALVEDCAQAHGARFRGALAGGFGAIACFSFYPTKNLGALGDAGALTTNDADLSRRLRMLRNYGERPDQRYHHAIPGYNSRLDEIQAAILRVKLRHLDAWNARRREIAARYDALLQDAPITRPLARVGSTHVYHLYVIRSAERDRLRAHLAEEGVGTQIHYPAPLHLQEANRSLGHGPGHCPHAESAAAEVLSLPIYPELTDAEIEHVAAAVNRFRP